MIEDSLEVEINLSTRIPPRIAAASHLLKTKFVEGTSLYAEIVEPDLNVLMWKSKAARAYAMKHKKYITTMTQHREPPPPPKLNVSLWSKMAEGATVRFLKDDEVSPWP